MSHLNSTLQYLSFLAVQALGPDIPLEELHRFFTEGMYESTDGDDMTDDDEMTVKEVRAKRRRLPLVTEVMCKSTDHDNMTIKEVGSKRRRVPQDAR